MVYGIADILKILPHRYPFLLVDRILEVEKGKRIVGIKNVTFNEGFFRALPAAGDAGAILRRWRRSRRSGSTSSDHEKLLPLGVDRCKFRRPVLPGDQHEIESSSRASSASAG